MKLILKFRLFYLAFVIVPILQFMDFRENIKESGFFTCLSHEFTLIVLLGLFIYLIERIVRVKYYKEKPSLKEILSKCIFSLIPCVSVIILSHIISKF